MVSPGIYKLRWEVISTFGGRSYGSESTCVVVLDEPTPEPGKVSVVVLVDKTCGDASARFDMVPEATIARDWVLSLGGSLSRVLSDAFDGLLADRKAKAAALAALPITPSPGTAHLKASGVPLTAALVPFATPYGLRPGQSLRSKPLIGGTFTFVDSATRFVILSESRTEIRFMRLYLQPGGVGAYKVCIVDAQRFYEACAPAKEPLSVESRNLLVKHLESASVRPSPQEVPPAPTVELPPAPPATTERWVTVEYVGAHDRITDTYRLNYHNHHQKTVMLKTGLTRLDHKIRREFTDLRSADYNLLASEGLCVGTTLVLTLEVSEPLAPPRLVAWAAWDGANPFQGAES